MSNNGSIWPLIRDRSVPTDGVHIWWLRQAGFVIKSPGGFMVCIDAYLTDSVMTSYGVARGYPAPLSPEESDFDVVLATHPHDDHMDPEAIIPFSTHPKTRYMGPFSVVKMARAGGFYGNRAQILNRGDIAERLTDRRQITMRHQLSMPLQRTQDLDIHKNLIHVPSVTRSI